MHEMVGQNAAIENSLNAFTAAAAAAIDMVELDIQMTRDGVVVVFHDATMERLTGVADKVSCFDFAQLPTLREQGPNGELISSCVPRFEDVLRVLPRSVAVHVEQKSGGEEARFKAAAALRAQRRGGAGATGGEVVFGHFSDEAACAHCAALLPDAHRLFSAAAVKRLLLLWLLGLLPFLTLACDFFWFPCASSASSLPHIPLLPESSPLIDAGMTSSRPCDPTSEAPRPRREPTSSTQCSRPSSATCAAAALPSWRAPT